MSETLHARLLIIGAGPAGWQKGDEGMTATAEGVARYLGEHAEAL